MARPKITATSAIGLPIDGDADITGSSYVAIWEAAARAATITLGGFKPEGDAAWDLESPRQTVPFLTNRQAGALVHAWLRATARSRVAWRLGLDIGAAALGWRKPGDRFDMTDQHQMAQLPRDLASTLWLWTYRLAEELDANQTVVRPLIFGGRRGFGGFAGTGYEELARVVWNAMKNEGLIPTLPLPSKPPPSPIDPVLPIVPTPGGGLGLALIVMGGLLLLAGRRRRRRRT